jgi:hypothetical protein
MAILDSATTITSTASNVISAAGSAINLSAIGEFFTTIPNLKLPLANPLSEFASYTYILSIGVLRDDELNFPDTTYRAGKKLKLICKSANADPNNRINTSYGKFDFFIDNLTLSSIIGHEKNNNTNVTKFTFDITEPYSMGIFPIACQQAAYEAGHKNWRSAPFILTIEFKGNRENGTMVSIPNTDRYIPFKFTELSMTVNHTGSKYTCNAIAYNQTALTSKHAQLKHEVSVKGKTVQEVLQTGEKSLQAVINQRLQQLAKDGIVPVPDEVVILFPKDISSSAGAAGASTPSQGATTGSGAGGSVIQKLGLTRSKINQTLVQDIKQVNELGSSIITTGESSIGKDNAVYDKDKNVYIRANNTLEIDGGELKFNQDTDIINVINQVLIKSEYPKAALGAKTVTKEGFRKWWKIDTQVFNISSDENLKSTGVKPQIIVYRVIPSNHHLSSGPMPPNVKPPGFQDLAKQAVKVYDYIYTGKNTEVLKFDITFKNSFSTMLSADAGQFNQDIQNPGSVQFIEKAVNKLLMIGNEPDKTLGVTPTQATYVATKSTTDHKGGGGPETAASRAARTFHDQINSGNDMIMLDMTIIGDPYFIAQSGTGNYTAKSSQFVNLNTDGSVNYQNGEVDIVVNFRTPVDINQVSGLYDFGGASKTSPVMQFSGLYRVTTVTSRFSNGEFKQDLKGMRRRQQESTQESSLSVGFNIDNIVQGLTDTGQSLLSGAADSISNFVGKIIK